MAGWPGCGSGGGWYREGSRGREMTGERLAGYLNALSDERARAALQRCCGARHWVDAMLAARPFASDAELLATAERVWWELGRPDWLEAFAAHPRIGGRVGAGMGWARRESAPGRHEVSRRYVPLALRHGGVLRSLGSRAVPSVRRDRVRDSRCRAVSRSVARQPVRLHDLSRQLRRPPAPP